MYYIDCIHIQLHGLRVPNEAFFHFNPKVLGLSRQIGQIDSWEFGAFWADLSTPIFVLRVPCPCFPLFLQKTTPLYPHLKYLFGIGIGIWTAKNLGFSLRVSVVCIQLHN